MDLDEFLAFLRADFDYGTGQADSSFADMRFDNA